MIPRGWPAGGFNWPIALFIIGYHVALAVGLPIYLARVDVQLATVVTAAVLLVLSQIGIGAAYHRFYAHRCFTLSRPAEALLLFLGTFATQGSVLQWSYEHRLHHSYVDTDRDPYSIRKGFWYAHVLWLFEHSNPIDEKQVKDLLSNPLVVFQHRHIVALMLGSNALVFVVSGWLLGDFLGAFVLIWWTRLCVSHHLTWFINSLAHCWGSRSFSAEHSAVDNYVVAMLTVGEGYHNFHHTFPRDYRNGVRWYHFDPVKWTVFLLSKLGLAGDLRRISPSRMRRRLLSEDLRLLHERLRNLTADRRAELDARVEAMSTRLRSEIERAGKLAERLRELRRDGASADSIRQVRRERKAAHRDLRRDWKAWGRLCSAVL